MAFLGVSMALAWHWRLLAFLEACCDIFPVVGIVGTVVGQVRRFAVLGVLERADRFVGCGSVFLPRARQAIIFLINLFIFLPLSYQVQV